MIPKQIGLREVMYETPSGPKPIGLIEFSTGHTAVTTYTLDQVVGVKNIAQEVKHSRFIECRRSRGQFNRHRTQRVIGLDGLEFALSREVPRLGVDECHRILDWFSSQGLSASLWDPQDELDRAADAGRRYCNPKEFKLERSRGKLPVRTIAGAPDMFGPIGKLPPRSSGEMARITTGDAEPGSDMPPGSPFDAIRHIDESGEHWFAREMGEAFNYMWKDMGSVVDRSKLACTNGGEDVAYHFTDVSKVMQGGRWGQQTVEDVRLSRFGCYLIAMNGDPRKPEVSAAQRYFAIRTRQAETQSASNENLTQILGVMMEQIRTTREHAVALVDHERRIVEAAEKAEKALAEIQRMQEARPVFEGVYTIQEFARHLGCPLQSARKIKDRQELGEFLTAICEDRGANFVRGYRTTELGYSVNGYPVEVLREFKNHFVDFEGTRPERAVVIPRLKKLIGDQKPTAFDFTRRSN